MVCAGRGLSGGVSVARDAGSRTSSLAARIPRPLAGQSGAEDVHLDASSILPVAATADVDVGGLAVYEGDAAHGEQQSAPGR